MPEFGPKSLEKLNTCDGRLQRVFLEVIKYRDCTILEGHRGEQEQNECCEKGLSKVKWPNSLHNRTPSFAADVMPFPIDWNDRQRIAHFAGFVLGIAASQGVNLRWGGDWNRNGTISDETFIDMPHYEIVGD